MKKVFAFLRIFFNLKLKEIKEFDLWLIPAFVLLSIGLIICLFSGIILIIFTGKVILYLLFTITSGSYYLELLVGITTLVMFFVIYLFMVWIKSNVDRTLEIRRNKDE